ncbi:ribosomal protein S5 domain 2-type fold domain-containing protein [Parathielavia hyrcaniae]|uniref:Ribosomal RNA-processing protein 43 n=1 Tax=Parathielavia hyrcaniae TaxID=113614 RepID=A0AAN6Q3R9_9PEZI|nr:ribosomal protein S5 domain 2-type fold domain-containing protein [Parathielavia hyrcaniae]
MAGPTISLPAPIFAKISPHPFLVRSLTRSTAADHPPCRANGRATQELRPVRFNATSLSHAHGSALVRLGDTTVLCGVRGELLPVERIPQFRPVDKEELRQQGENNNGNCGDAIGRGELRDYDLLVPNIELATGSAPQFLPGVPPTTLAQTLSTRVYSLLHSTGLVQAGDLKIWYSPKEQRRGEDVEMGGTGDKEDGDEEERPVAYWVLYIDLLFVSFDGNPFDVAWAAVVAALRDTRLPVARWDPDREVVVCSKTERRRLNVRGLPVACSAAVFMEKEQSEAGAGPREGGHWLLLDPDRLEETLCKEVITMVVDCSDDETRIKSLEKQGGTLLGRELIRGYAGIAERRWKEVRTAME